MTGDWLKRSRLDVLVIGMLSSHNTYEPFTQLPAPTASEQGLSLGVPQNRMGKTP